MNHDDQLQAALRNQFKLLPISKLKDDPRIKAAGLSEKVMYSLKHEGLVLLGGKTSVEAVLEFVKRKVGHP